MVVPGFVSESDPSPGSDQQIFNNFEWQVYKKKKKNQKSTDNAEFYLISG